MQGIFLYVLYVCIKFERHDDLSISWRAFSCAELLFWEADFPRVFNVDYPAISICIEFVILAIGWVSKAIQLQAFGQATTFGRYCDMQKRPLFGVCWKQPR